MPFAVGAYHFFHFAIHRGTLRDVIKKKRRVFNNYSCL